MAGSFFVTGNSSGIGLALTRNLLSRGQTGVGLSSGPPLAGLEGADYRHIQADLRHPETLAGAILDSPWTQQVFDSETVFLNAGIFGPTPRRGAAIDLADFVDVQNVNFISNKVLLDLLMRNGRAKIVVISSSISSIRQRAGMSAYATSKAAVSALVKTYALEYPDIFFANIGLCNVSTQLGRKVLEPQEDLPELLALRERASTPGYLATPEARAGHVMQVVDGVFAGRITSGDFVEIRDLLKPDPERGICQGKVDAGAPERINENNKSKSLAG